MLFQSVVGAVVVDVVVDVVVALLFDNVSVAYSVSSLDDLAVVDAIHGVDAISDGLAVGVVINGAIDVGDTSVVVDDPCRHRGGFGCCC